MTDSVFYARKTDRRGGFAGRNELSIKKASPSADRYSTAMGLLVSQKNTTSYANYFQVYRLLMRIQYSSSLLIPKTREPKRIVVKRTYLSCLFLPAPLGAAASTERRT
jgi:hypothetical protein